MAISQLDARVGFPAIVPLVNFRKTSQTRPPIQRKIAPRPKATCELPAISTDLANQPRAGHLNEVVDGKERSHADRTRFRSEESRRQAHDRPSRESADNPEENGVPTALSLASDKTDGGAVLAMHFRKQDTSLRSFTTIATLGTSQDVTLQELRIECFFPMDDATAALLRSWAKVPRQGRPVRGS
jgi:hypothetical protein